MLEILAEHGCQATWFASDPAAEPIVQLVRKSSRNEVGLAIDDRSAGKGSLSIGDLLRSLSHCEQQGLGITTLSCTAVPEKSVLDLLAKRGVSAIRATDQAGHDSAKRAGSRGPTNLRFGLWQVAIDGQLTNGGFMNLLTGMRLRRGIDRAIAQKSAWHLAIDLRLFSGSGALGALARLDKTLTHIEQRCECDDARVATIGQLIEIISPGPVVRGARSILRAA